MKTKSFNDKVNSLRDFLKYIDEPMLLERDENKEWKIFIENKFGKQSFVIGNNALTLKMLSTLLSDKTKRIRHHSVLILEQLNSKESIGLLEKAFEEESNSDVKISIAFALINLTGIEDKYFNFLNKFKNKMPLIQRLEFQEFLTRKNLLNSISSFEIIKQEIGTLKESINQEESKEKQIDKVISVEKKLEIAIHDIFDKMKKDPTKTLEYSEALRNVGVVRQENWWKRNIVQLIGFTLTFVTALIAAVASFYN